MGFVSFNLNCNAACVGSCVPLGNQLDGDLLPNRPVVFLARRCYERFSSPGEDDLQNVFGEIVQRQGLLGACRSSGDHSESCRSVHTAIRARDIFLQRCDGCVGMCRNGRWKRRRADRSLKARCKGELRTFAQVCKHAAATKRLHCSALARSSLTHEPSQRGFSRRGSYSLAANAHNSLRYVCSNMLQASHLLCC